MKKSKVILTLDPGVDDATLLTMAATDKKIDIEMVAIADGNISQDVSIKNALFLLDILNVDMTVVPGQKIKKRTDAEGKAAQKRAEELHGKGSIGGIKTPKTVHHQAQNVDVADKMFEIISSNPHKVSILACTPLTDVAYLFEKHKEAIKLVKQVVIVGGSFGLPGQPDHISYNAGTNAKAFDTVLHSGASCVVIPSLIGRTSANFSDKQVEEISTMGNYGAFLAKTFSTYWETGFEDKFVSNNDVCSYLFITHKNMFKTQPFDIEVNLGDHPGKLTRTPNKRSCIQVVTKMNRKKFVNIMYNKIRSMQNFGWTNS